METSLDAETNPLLVDWDLPFGLPPFAQAKPEHFRPALERAMQPRLVERGTTRIERREEVHLVARGAEHQRARIGGRRAHDVVGDHVAPGCGRERGERRRG